MDRDFPESAIPHTRKWDGSVVQINHPGFQLQSLVQHGCAFEQQADIPDDLLYKCILSSSPLTSLDSSRSPSPNLHSVEVPLPPRISTSSTIKGTINLLENLVEKQKPLSTPNKRKIREYNETAETRDKLEENVEDAKLAQLKRKNEKNKKQSKANRKKKRRLHAESLFVMPAVASEIHQKHVQRSEALHTSNDMKEGRTTQNAYIAKSSPHESSTTHQLDDLVGPTSSFDFQLVKWDGITPKPLIDSVGRMFGLLAGQADQNTWQEDMKRAAHMIDVARRECTFSKEDHHQRPRGPFPVLRCGVSHGGGQVEPCNISHRDTKKNRKVIHRLNRARPFHRISNFISSVFASWAPDLHKHYADAAQAIYGKYPDLERPFPRSPFSATTYNMGPCTVCVPHTDKANLTYGWCAIAALGDYDPTRGGHLVLWECKLVIEFPPGSIVFIPSAIITHSNTPIQPNEHRYSFTQYTAGALFRWVDQEFKSQKDFRGSKGKDELASIDEKLANRWSLGLNLLPCLNL